MTTPPLSKRERAQRLRREREGLARRVLTPVAPEVPPRGLRSLASPDSALPLLDRVAGVIKNTPDGDPRDIADYILGMVETALAATRTPEPPDSGDGGIDLAAILDEMDARIAEDEGKAPRSGWMTAQQIKQLGSLRGQSAAVGWLRNRLRLRSGSLAPEGGE